MYIRALLAAWLSELPDDDHALTVFIIERVALFLRVPFALGYLLRDVKGKQDP